MTQGQNVKVAVHALQACFGASKAKCHIVSVCPSDCVCPTGCFCLHHMFYTLIPKPKQLAQKEMPMPVYVPNFMLGEAATYQIVISMYLKGVLSLFWIGNYHISIVAYLVLKGEMESPLFDLNHGLECRVTKSGVHLDVQCTCLFAILKVQAAVCIENSSKLHLYFSKQHLRDLLSMCYYLPAEFMYIVPVQ